MTVIESWVQTPLARALGWTLVHSLWQGLLMAVVLAAALCAMRSSRARYAAACLAMFAVLLAFGLTLARLTAQQGSRQAIMTPPPTSRAASSFEHPTDPAGSAAELSLSYILPWLAPFWIAGVVLFHLRNLASWTAARRMSSRGVCQAPDFWQERLYRLGARLHLSRPVALLESCLAEAPVVIGHVRPVILMPVGLLAGMPADQIEWILLHELAHIRRYDYLANLLQTSVEGLLFYHPAVWWISGVIRVERENCCDDLAVDTNGDAHEYAVALAALEQNRSAVRPTAMAATGGSLVKRIRRLLKQPERPHAALTPVLSAVILTITAAAVLAAWQSKPAVPSPSAAGVQTGWPPVKLLAQGREPAPDAEASPYLKWFNEDAPYIITDAEATTFLRLQTDAEREHFIEQFWERRNPTPGSSENKFKEEHFRRIAYANERFTWSGGPGWKSDRGRMYITFGPPDEIESHPSGGNYVRSPEEGGGQTVTYPFEQWRYRFIEGVGNDVIMDFVDTARTGEYRMTIDPSEKEAQGRAAAGARSSFFSRPTTTPGMPVIVEITRDRRMFASIPIEFDAPKYAITGLRRSVDGRDGWRVVFTSGVTLCKNSPGAGCLERPVFHPILGYPQLEPGSYEFQAIVRDQTGIMERKYTLTFQVK